MEKTNLPLLLQSSTSQSKVRRCEKNVSKTLFRAAGKSARRYTRTIPQGSHASCNCVHQCIDLCILSATHVEFQTRKKFQQSRR